MKNRIIEIDILKSIGIILMIIGHLYPGTLFDKWLHAFHMPMFFIISGFLYKKPSSIAEFIMAKFKRLVIPYLFFGFFHLFLLYFGSILINKQFGNLSGYIYHVFWMNMNGLPICGAIWFLTAYFFTNIIFSLIDIYIHRKSSKYFTFVLLTFIGMVLPYYNIRLPLSLDIGMMGVSLHFIGTYLRTLYNKHNLEIKPIYGVIGLLVFVIPISLNSTINLRLGDYGNPFLYFINAVSMTLSMYFICVKINKEKNIIVNELCYIGQNSIVYLGFNQLVIIAIKNIPIFSMNLNVFSIFLKIIFITITLFILHIISFMIGKCKLDWLIGK